MESAINNLQWRMECIINNPGWRSSVLPRSLVRRPATLCLINRCAVFGQPPAHRSSFAPCGWRSDEGDRFITKRRVQKLESMRYQPTNPASFPSSRFWPRVIADSSMSQAMQRRPRLRQTKAEVNPPPQASTTRWPDWREYLTGYSTLLCD